jgi:hypothetical protein
VPIGGNCESSPFSVSLSSGPGFTVNGGGPLSGSYTFPPMHGCGLLTPVLNMLIPGPGNTFNLTLGPLQPGCPGQVAGRNHCSRNIRLIPAGRLESAVEQLRRVE